MKLSAKIVHNILFLLLFYDMINESIGLTRTKAKKSFKTKSAKTGELTTTDFKFQLHRIPSINFKGFRNNVITTGNHLLTENTHRSIQALIKELQL